MVEFLRLLEFMCVPVHMYMQPFRLERERGRRERGVAYDFRTPISRSIEHHSDLPTFISLLQTSGNFHQQERERIDESESLVSTIPVQFCYARSVFYAKLMTFLQDWLGFFFPTSEKKNLQTRDCILRSSKLVLLARLQLQAQLWPACLLLLCTLAAPVPQ